MVCSLCGDWSSCRAMFETYTQSGSDTSTTKGFQRDSSVTHKCCFAASLYTAHAHKEWAMTVMPLLFCMLSELIKDKIEAQAC